MTQRVTIPSRAHTSTHTLMRLPSGSRRPTHIYPSMERDQGHGKLTQFFSREALDRTTLLLN